MPVLELRWPLLALILILITVVLMALQLDRRRAGQRAAEIFTDAANTLSRSIPLSAGWSRRGAERYVYANEYARLLLELKASSGPVPAVEWDLLLDDDHPPCGWGCWCSGTASQIWSSD